MRAAVLHEVPGDLVIEDVDVDKPGPQELLVRTATAGVCHSDLHFMEGKWPSVVPAVAPDEEARLIRLRMQGVVDQMQASVAKLDGWSITLRDIDSGLIDFPALASGRQIWLCWRLGEDDVDWWHRVDEGFSGRRRLAERSQRKSNGAEAGD